MTLNSKITTYIGFALKSNSIVIGLDDILKSKKPKLLLSLESLSENSQKKLNEYAKDKQILYIKIGEEILSKIFSDKNVKVVAITDKNLANAIINLCKN